MNNRPFEMALRARPVAAVRAAGQAAAPTDVANNPNYALDDNGNIVQVRDPATNTWSPYTGAQPGTGSTPGANQSNNSNLSGAQVASIINTTLQGVTTIGTAQINSDRARDIAETNAATLQAIERIRADIAANPNSAQTAVLQSQLQALTAFAQQRDMFRSQQQQWLTYALVGVAGLGLVGGAVLLLRARARKNPVVDAHGRPQGLKGRHYVPAAELRRRRARHGR